MSNESLSSIVEDYATRRIDRRTFFMRAAAVGVAFPTIAAIAAACTSGTKTGGPTSTATLTPKSGGTLIEGYDRDVSRMDPVTTGWWDPTLFPATHETVITADANGKFVPMLCDSWVVSSDALTWTFKIRSGLKFHSGAVCDANAVAEAMNAFRSTKLGAVNAGFWTPVKDIVATDPATVQVTLTHPYADLAYVLNTGYSAIFNMATWKQLKGDYGAKGEDGTGPFKLKEFVPGSHVTLEKWQDYPGSVAPFFQNKGVPYVDAIQWQVLVEPATRAQQIQQGNVMALHGPAPQDVASLKQKSDLVVIEFQEWSLYQLGLNFKRTDLGFDDVRVRQAVSHAIDRKGIADKVFFGLASPTYTMVPSAFPYYDSSVEQCGTYDVNLAKSLLEQAGWTGASGTRTKNGVSLSFSAVIESDATEQLVAQAIQGMLAAVGIDMTFTAHGADYFEKASAGPPAYMIKNLWPYVFDASLLFAGSGYFPPLCCNWQFAKIAELDTALNAWQSAANDQQLAAAAKQALLISAQQVPFVPIVTPTNVWVHNTKVHGWQPSQSNLYPFYQDVWIES